MRQLPQKINKLTIGLSLLILVFSCHNYYKAKTTTNAPGTQKAHLIDSMKSENRYFVLRNGTSEAYYMHNLVLSADQKTLECELDTLSPLHKLHLVKGRDGKMKYKKYQLEDKGVLNEIHLYIPAEPEARPGKYLLALDKVQTIEVLEIDRKRTTTSYVLGALGYTVGALTVAGIIIAATKSSCPFVSADDGDRFVLQGEIYGGAIYPQMARDDYMPLRMKPNANGLLQVKISNELQEKQFTDVADLLVITHDQNSRVLADEKGNLYQVSEPQTPLSAVFCNNNDVLESISKAHDNRLLHFDDTLSLNASNYADISFSKPAEASKAKLVLSIKNSYWLDYLYGQVAKGLGTYYSTYTNDQLKKPAADLIKWTKDQKMPLEVLIKTSDGWQKLTDITTIGPVATRDVVVPIDVSNINGTVAEIRLSSGFMFWEIDYVAIDYSTDAPIKVETLSPIKAIDETGKNVLPLLSKSDGTYLEQPVPGNVATIQYKAQPIAEGKTHSYIFHTRGYYTHVRDFQNKPDINFLSQFRKPGALANFSLSLYKKFRNTNLESLAAH